jgi:hypothetical protein
MPNPPADSAHGSLEPAERELGGNGDSQYLRERIASRIMEHQHVPRGSYPQEWDRNNPKARIHNALGLADICIQVFREIYPSPPATPDAYWYLKERWEQDLRRSLGIQLIRFAEEMERSTPSGTAHVVHDIGSRILRSEI